MLKKILFIKTVILASSLLAGTGFSQNKIKYEHRVLNTSIWYPTDTIDKELIGENIVFKGFKASSNSKIKEGKFPLIVLVHGTTGNWKNLSWLAQKLSNSGSIVIAANHPGYTSRDSNAQSVLRMWNQAKDVSFIITNTLESSLKNNIDKKNIFVLGYSLGGYTALALSGAKLDMKNYSSFCEKNSNKACKYFKSSFPIIDKEYLKNSSQDLSDIRINASIAIAPGFVQSMTNESLKSITLPTLLIGAQYDENVPVKIDILPKLKYFSKKIKYQEIADASHFSFMQICKEKAMQILAEEDAQFVCRDGKKKTREHIHDELFNIVNDYINIQKQ
ncbi:MAG: alpha/beta fold hydrolase [Campylobacteraceae bacterium]|nr:alpha/beta fold hydrolase [Campylobacteraceae bacterium]